MDLKEVQYSMGGGQSMKGEGQEMVRQVAGGDQNKEEATGHAKESDFIREREKEKEREHQICIFKRSFQLQC